MTRSPLRCCTSIIRSRWCRPHPVCLLVALALGHGGHFIKNYISTISSREFSLTSWKSCISNLHHLLQFFKSPSTALSGVYSLERPEFWFVSHFHFPLIPHDRAKSGWYEFSIHESSVQLHAQRNGGITKQYGQCVEDFSSDCARSQITRLSLYTNAKVFITKHLTKCPSPCFWLCLSRSTYFLLCQFLALALAFYLALSLSLFLTLSLSPFLSDTLPLSLPLSIFHSLFRSLLFSPSVFEALFHCFSTSLAPDL